MLNNDTFVAKIGVDTTEILIIWRWNGFW